MTTRKTFAKPATLPTRLRRARTLLQTWQRAVKHSHTEPHSGRVTDAAALRELDEFIMAIQALTEAINIVQPPRKQHSDQVE